MLILLFFFSIVSTSMQVVFQLEVNHKHARAS